MSDEPIEILLVEDNPHDVELALHALQKNNLSNRIHVVRDGAEALDFIFGTGPYVSPHSNGMPKVILLDLKLPKIDGLEVLKRIKADPRTRLIPVVVLTTSRARDDVLRSYDLHANCYITKPVDLDQFITVVRSVEEFWFTIVKLPPDGMD